MFSIRDGGSPILECYIDGTHRYSINLDLYTRARNPQHITKFFNAFLEWIPPNARVEFCDLIGQSIHLQSINFLPSETERIEEMAIKAMFELVSKIENFVFKHNGDIFISNYMSAGPMPATLEEYVTDDGSQEHRKERTYTIYTIYTTI